MSYLAIHSEIQSALNVPLNTAGGLALYGATTHTVPNRFTATHTDWGLGDFVKQVGEVNGVPPGNFLVVDTAGLNGASGYTEVTDATVRYNVAQSLDSGQRTQAQANMGLGTAATTAATAYATAAQGTKADSALQSYTESDPVASAALTTHGNLTTSAHGGLIAESAIDTDTALTANSNSRLPSQQAVKAYVDNYITGLQWKDRKSVV